MLIDGKKVACATCIKGHRATHCNHKDRPMVEIKKKGRPATQCKRCRELRLVRQLHVKCNCNEEKVLKRTRMPSSSNDDRDTRTVKKLVIDISKANLRAIAPKPDEIESADPLSSRQKHSSSSGINVYSHSYFPHASPDNSTTVAISIPSLSAIESTDHTLKPSSPAIIDSTSSTTIPQSITPLSPSLPPLLLSPSRLSLPCSCCPGRQCRCKKPTSRRSTGSCCAASPSTPAQPLLVPKDTLPTTSSGETGRTSQSLKMSAPVPSCCRSTSTSATRSPSSSPSSTLPLSSSSLSSSISSSSSSSPSFSSQSSSSSSSSSSSPVSSSCCNSSKESNPSTVSPLSKQPPMSTVRSSNSSDSYSSLAISPSPYPVTCSSALASSPSLPTSPSSFQAGAVMCPDGYGKSSCCSSKQRNSKGETIRVVTCRCGDDCACPGCDAHPSRAMKSSQQDPYAGYTDISSGRRRLSIAAICSPVAPSSSFSLPESPTSYNSSPSSSSTSPMSPSSSTTRMFWLDSANEHPPPRHQQQKASPSDDTLSSSSLSSSTTLSQSSISSVSLTPLTHQWTKQSKQDDMPTSILTEDGSLLCGCGCSNTLGECTDCFQELCQDYYANR